MTRWSAPRVWHLREPSRMRTAARPEESGSQDDPDVVDVGAPGRARAAFLAALALLSTVCCAWRWSLVARGLGVSVPLPTAVAAYYRSLFLNTTLPGGLVGDVHRGVRHGRDVGDVGRGLRAVGWERSAGQVVQLALTVVVGWLQRRIRTQPTSERPRWRAPATVGPEGAARG